jgi:hypothetical protein
MFSDLCLIILKWCPLKLRIFWIGYLFARTGLRKKAKKIDYPSFLKVHAGKKGVKFNKHLFFREGILKLKAILKFTVINLRMALKFQDVFLKLNKISCGRLI